MSITDELREAINELRVECEEKEGCGVLWYPEPTRDRFGAIADRIDQEHDKLMAECQDDLLIMDVKLEKLASTLNCLCHELGVEIGSKKDSQIHSELVEAARNTIPLPKDADGVLIHIGDELEWLDGNRLTVNGIGEGGTLFYVDVQGDVQWTASGDKRHVKPDSWEAIIEEAASYGDKRWFSGTQGDKAIIAELVERCKRLAGDAE